ncbi:Hypothetical predicted protein [Paramuricea clavata]|uniref:Uncharacterized protein n=1 Tax=Paramuricea clavata TaxID=317549 RepID=A0A7D9HGJ1_PARCT|nr:Hypothetical predicted protein [Paramuricea clavata]
MKKSIKLNLPMQIGFFVYQYAKLCMLEFYFDCIDKFLDSADFQYCEMDTDLAYVALPSIDALVRPELKADYKLDWFSWDYNAKIKAYDKRTPGLFKTDVKL